MRGRSYFWETEYWEAERDDLKRLVEILEIELKKGDKEG